MSKRRALMMALRKVVGSRQTGMLPKSEAARTRSARGIEAMADRQRGNLIAGADDEMAVSANIDRLDAARRRMSPSRPPRTNASPISVVDNEFDAPVRAAASSPSLPPAAALQAMPMARLKALFESYMGEPLARRSLTTRKDIIFEMEERARALDAADTIKRHS